MTDVDAKIAGKEAEYETLSRGVAALLEKHEQLREGFKRETKENATKAEKELTKKLSDRTKELSRLEKQVTAKQEELKKASLKLEDTKSDVSSELERLTSERTVVEGVVSRLTTEKLSLESEIQVKSTALNELTTSIDSKRNEVADLDRLIKEKTEDKEVAFSENERFKLEIAVDRELLEAEVTELGNKKLSLTAELNDLSKLLAQTRNEEELIRENLADTYIKLDRKEKSVEAREAKVAQQEKRLFNYSKFSGL